MDSAEGVEAQVFTRRYAQSNLDYSSVLMVCIHAGVVVIDAVPKRFAIFFSVGLADHGLIALLVRFFGENCVTGQKRNSKASIRVTMSRPSFDHPQLCFGYIYLGCQYLFYHFKGLTLTCLWETVEPSSLFKR